MDKTEELEKRIEVLERAILKHAEMINDLAHLGSEDAQHLMDHIKEESDYKESPKEPMA